MGPNAGLYLADYTGQHTPGFKRTLSQYFDPAKYSTPLLGRYGNTNKSPELTPYYTDFDASFGKTTRITDSQSFLLRCEIFNVAST
jgi:hypothetical protein